MVAWANEIKLLQSELSLQDSLDGAVVPTWYFAPQLFSPKSILPKATGFAPCTPRAPVAAMLKGLMTVAKGSIGVSATGHESLCFGSFDPSNRYLFGDRKAALRFGLLQKAVWGVH